MLQLKKKVLKSCNQKKVNSAAFPFPILSDHLLLLPVLAAPLVRPLVRRQRPLRRERLPAPRLGARHVARLLVHRLRGVAQSDLGFINFKRY